jgi:hypothetical protein
MKMSFAKDELLTILRTNREQHRAIFLEACDGYQKEAIRQLQAHMRQVRKGTRKRISIYLDAPVEQTKSYDRVIKMIEMTTEDIIALTEAEFANYVLDEWSWKQDFLSSNSTYSATAMRMSADPDYSNV